MNRYLIVCLLLGVTACGDKKPPVDWMYAEYRNLFLICQEGQRVPEKTSTASLTYTWSCPYPENFQEWLLSLEENNLTPRGWTKSETQPPYSWKTYCNSHQKLVMRIVEVKAKAQQEEDRVWISIRFPGRECPDPAVGYSGAAAVPLF